NVRVFFDFQQPPLIDTFNTARVNALVSADVVVEREAIYHIQVDYKEITDAAFLFFDFANLATNPSGPNFDTPVNIPVSGGPWTAQYYANDGLVGDPVAILSVDRISQNWGSGSPQPSVPADFFSARWTSVLTLENDTYTITTRVDDGVRVFVNGNIVIDQWNIADGATYTADVALQAGAHVFIVEYFEATGDAFVEFDITRRAQAEPPSNVNQPGVTGATATVTAFRLNVRSLPNPVTGEILTRINRNETYDVLGQNVNGSWYLLQVNNIRGWVSGAYVNVTPGIAIPFVDDTTQAGANPSQPVATGFQVTATPYTVNIRTGPGTQFARLSRLPLGRTAEVIGRTINNLWWQIDYNGIVGWVSSDFAIIDANVDINRIPVTG
ncbi:MAG: SH3 domain-containing protein, partial [Chloroflexi bacterium]|nr:SH3 domain-containing protein [Chloroflexota bacterium]